MKRIKTIIPLIGIGFVLIIAQFQPSNTYAQFGNSTTWFPPVNISKSGGVTKPTLIVDPKGIFTQFGRTISLDLYIHMEMVKPGTTLKQ